MLVEKDVLRPGTYRLADGSLWVCTCQDIRNALVQGNRQIKNGLSVPLVWEHDLDAVPTPFTALLSQLTPRNRREWAAGFAKHAFGYVAGYSLRIEDSKPVLYTTNEIPDRADAEQWAKTRYCSPRCDRDFVDGSGRVYPGLSVTHVAATPKPVQTNQRAVSLSLTHRGRSRETVYLSADSLQGYEMADEKKGDAGDSGGDGAGMQRLMAALSQAYGFTAPDSCKNMDDLCLAIEAVAANKGGTDTDMDGDGTPDATDTDTTSAGGAPVMMSDTARKAESKLMTALKRILVQRAEKVVERGMKIGAIDGPAGKDLIRRCGGADLSLTDTGDVARSEVTIELDALERVVNTLSKRQTPAQLSNTVSATIPAGVGPTGEEEKALIARLRKAAEDRVALKPAK